MAHKKYRQSLDELVKIGRADQLAASHRYMLSWIKTMEEAITEQQRIILKRAKVDPQRDKISLFLLQMPSDKAAGLCIIHLMKHLFTQFLDEYKFNSDELALLINDDKELK